MKNNSLWVLLALLLWCSCEKPEPEVPVVPSTPEKEETYITWTKQDLAVFPAEGGKDELSFNTNGKWSASVDMWSKGWCSLTPNQGKAGAVSLMIVVSENTTYEGRKATIVVKAGDVADTLYVIQEGQVKPECYLKLNPDSHNVPNHGGLIQTLVETNVDYVVRNSGVDWLYETFEYGGGVEAKCHHFVVNTNDSYETRSAEIIFANELEGISDTLYITQEAREKPENYLSLSMDTCKVKFEGQTVAVYVNTNVDYVVTVPDVKWLRETYSYGGGVKARCHHFEVDKNNTYGRRSVEVTFANEKEGVMGILYIMQEGLNEKGSIDEMPEHPL